MKKPEVDWTFLDRVNTTSFQGWAAVWLWIFTGAVWGIAAIIAAITGKELPVAWLATWLTGIAGLAGIGALQFNAMRNTDYGALDRKAKAAAAAAGKPAGEGDAA